MILFQDYLSLPYLIQSLVLEELVLLALKPCPKTWTVPPSFLVALLSLDACQMALLMWVQLYHVFLVYGSRFVVIAIHLIAYYIIAFSKSHCNALLLT